MERDTERYTALLTKMLLSEKYHIGKLRDAVWKKLFM